MVHCWPRNIHLISKRIPIALPSTQTYSKANYYLVNHFVKNDTLNNSFYYYIICFYKFSHMYYKGWSLFDIDWGSIIYFFDKYLLSPYYMLDPLLDSDGKVVKQRKFTWNKYQIEIVLESSGPSLTRVTTCVLCVDIPCESLLQKLVSLIKKRKKENYWAPKVPSVILNIYGEIFSFFLVFFASYMWT